MRSQNEQIQKVAESSHEMESLFSGLLKKMNTEIIENDKLEYMHAEMKDGWRQQKIKNEMELSHLNTKTRLLKQALTKKNNDVNELEDNNQGMVELIENSTKSFEETK